MLSIGEFSKICSVTTKTLRYYDEIGLIHPSYTADNGYRYYKTDQLKTMLFINRLKKYEFTLDEIAILLKENTEEQLFLQLKQQENKMISQMEYYSALLNQVRQDISNLERGKPIMSYINDYKVDLVERDPVSILYSRQKMNTDEFGKYIGKLYETIAKEHLTPIGNVLSIYHDSEFSHQSSDIEIGIPIQENRKDTRLLNGGLHATLTHKGNYSDLGGAYAKLTEWIETEGYQLAAPPFEIYSNSPNQQNPEEQITAIYAPVIKK